jgi:superfamily I DNA and/or RNA helicase
VGTVHTFQGKEADAVIFILGGDDDSQGALNWASDKPNILNVAATWAKYRLCVVGTHRLWSKLRNFDEASSLLPCETVTIIAPEEPITIESEPPLLSSLNLFG